jgi:uncharacterized protein (TIGR02270 family)
MSPVSEPFWDLVEESLEEAVFFWKRWEAELASPVRSLEEVRSWTEDRLQGALDGVRVAGASLERMARPGLESNDPTQLAVCAHLLAARSAAAARTGLAEIVAEASGPRLWHMVRGIEVAELDASFTPVATVLSAGEPEHLAALCRLKAFRRSPPGREVAEVFASGEPRLQIEALRLLRYAKDDSAGRYVAAGLRSDSPAVRQAAIECGVRQRQANAWDTARKLVYERDPHSGPCLSLLAALGTAEDARLVIAALTEPVLQRVGLFALGYVGTPEAVEICLTGMGDPHLARGAGEAYCAITGAHLEHDQLVAQAAPEAESPPPLAADPLDADLVPAPQDLWPLPQESSVREHWQGVKARFAPGARYWAGKPVDSGALVASIESGPMLRRPDLISELNVRSAGRYDVEPRAFAHVQRRMMAAGRGAMR